MASLSKMILIGRLGHDPDFKLTATQKPVVNLNVAVSEVSMKNGQKEEKTEWYRVVAWDKLAENCQKYLRKGSEVYVEGRASLKNWTDKEGNPRSAIEVSASSVLFLSPPKDKGAPQNSEHYVNPSAKQASRPLNDDVPF